jgi:hypothetical protein
MTTRRLPAPWRIEKIPGGYVVRDANGQTLAYVYIRATETDAMQAKVLTDDEGRRVATNIARLPELLGTKNEGPPLAGPRTFSVSTSPEAVHAGARSSWRSPSKVFNRRPHWHLKFHSCE